jgi:hypothetical protein
MQLFKKIYKNPFVFFPLLTCIFFWPIVLQLFTFKNDALTYYYPVRTLISDALHNGELPLWTPYINMGYPLHADMQSGAWSPIIWLFSALTNYRLFGFHLEMLFYFSFAGIGFYYLCKQMGWSNTVALVMGISYEYCGFMIDSVQFFVCISAACYLPYILLFFHKTITKGGYHNAIFTGFFLSLLFTGSYPAMFIITIYLLLMVGVYWFYKNKHKWAFIQQKWWLIFLMVGVFTLISLPAIISFINHLPYIDRGKKQALDFVQQNSLVPASLVSILNPFSTTASEEWLQTDALMRSTYMGVLPILFIVYGFKKKLFKKKRLGLFFLLAGLTVIAIAFGKYFVLHEYLYDYLPLMNTFRHPALFRLFAIFLLLLASGLAMNSWMNKMDTLLLGKAIKVYGYLLAIVSFLVMALFMNELFSQVWQHVSAHFIFQQSNFIQRYIIQMPLLVIVWIFVYRLNKRGVLHQYLALICIATSFVTTQMNMPITIIGAKDYHTVIQHLQRNPVLFPLPDSNSIQHNSVGTIDTLNITGSILPFSKKVGRNDYFITPGNLSMQDSFYESKRKEEVFSHPLLYTSSLQVTDSNSEPLNSRIEYVSFAANKMVAVVTNNQPVLLHYLQNNYPGWVATVDGKYVPIQKVNIAFMAIELPAGRHTIAFIYQPNNIFIAWLMSTVAFVATILLLLLFCKRRFFNNGQ